jgi:hypothetical protein
MREVTTIPNSSLADGRDSLKARLQRVDYFYIAANEALAVLEGRPLNVLMSRTYAH